MNFEKIAHNIKKNENGIYYSKSDSSLSYPEDGNEDNDAGHFKRYTTTELSELLKKCGFSIIQSTYIFSILPLPVFLLRSLPSKLGFNKKSNELQKHQNEHKQKKGILNAIKQRIWKWELSRVNRNKNIPIVGSFFVIGKKVANNM